MSCAHHTIHHLVARNQNFKPFNTLKSAWGRVQLPGGCNRYCSQKHGIVNEYHHTLDVQIPAEVLGRLWVGGPNIFSGGVWMTRDTSPPQMTPPSNLVGKNPVTKSDHFSQSWIQTPHQEKKTPKKEVNQQWLPKIFVASPSDLMVFRFLLQE